MKKDIPDEEIETQEEVKFGYSSSVVFLIFIGFIIYISVK
ncbi:MAG: hypothetical protein ACI9TV_002171 [Sulfurimonas sp.]|jgi:hypothetical protein